MTRLRKTLVRALALLTLVALAPACSSDDDGDTTGTDTGATSADASTTTGGTDATSSGGDSGATAQIDAELLAEYRAALPPISLLTARSPLKTGTTSGALTAALLGETAIYPAALHPVVTGVNEAVSGIVALLELITDTPPTVYDSEKKEFVWGPWPDDDTALEGDYALAWIKDERDDPDRDFDFVYVLGRGMGRDLASFTPVLFGGATPDPDDDDRGTGVTLWDFEANKTFADEHDPGHGDMDQGRFVAFYTRGPDEEDAETEITIVLAAFRNFVTVEDAGDAPVDIDYLYGHVDGPAWDADFVDVGVTGDVWEPDGVDTDKAETLRIHAAFVNDGRGRAEAQMTGGDLEDVAEVATIQVLECWDDEILQTVQHMRFLDDAGDEVSTETLGELTDCKAPFDQTLTELDVPSLESVDAELKQALEEVATNGVPDE